MTVYEATKIRIDLPRLKKECLDLVNTIGFNIHNQIGLVNPTNYNDNLYYYSTGKKAEELTEEDYNTFHPNHLDSYLHEIWQTMPWKIGRLRIARSRPQTCNTIHSDSSRRFHISITTNPHCWFVFPETSEVFHMPEDGAVHVFDTRQPHSFMNGGKELRVHLIGNLLE